MFFRILNSKVIHLSGYFLIITLKSNELRQYTRARAQTHTHTHTHARTTHSRWFLMGDPFLLDYKSISINFYYHIDFGVEILYMESLDNKRCR